MTRRQREIIRSFAQGLRAKEIARRLDLSPKTVQNQRYRLMRSLDLRTTSALVSYALENGLLEPAKIEGTAG